MKKIVAEAPVEVMLHNDSYKSIVYVFTVPLWLSGTQSQVN